MKTANSTAEVLTPIEEEAPAPAREEASLKHIFEQIAPLEAPKPAPVVEPSPALRTGRVLSMKGGGVQVAWRGRSEPVEADLDEGVDREIVERAMVNGDAVLIEIEPGGVPVVVGAIQTRIPETLEIKARSVVIDGEQEVLLRSGRAAMRVREDGDIEVVGSRISTMSRGLFRIVGRVLRLN